MRAFGEKPKTMQSVASLTSPFLNRGQLGQSPESNQILELQRAIGNQAVRRLLEKNKGTGFGPRRDGRETALNLGPQDSAHGTNPSPGTGTGAGCVFGPLQVITSGALNGGYCVDDYLLNGSSWGPVGTSHTAGRDGQYFKVQLCGVYSGAASLGVSQSFTIRGANQTYLYALAQYLDRTPGSVTNGMTINEPGLNESNPYARTGWGLLYGSRPGRGSASLVSFADVPRACTGGQGTLNFRTCFYSQGFSCQENSTCATWRWTFDFTGNNNINTVT